MVIFPALLQVAIPYYNRIVQKKSIATQMLFKSKFVSSLSEVNFNS